MKAFITPIKVELEIYSKEETKTTMNRRNIKLVNLNFLCKRRTLSII